MTDTTPFALPDNARQAMLTRRDVFLLSLRAVRLSIFRFFLIIPVMFFGLQMVSYGLDAALDPAQWLSFAKPISVTFLLGLLLIFLLTRRKINSMKALEIPMLFGFDREAMYASCLYYQSRVRWEYFIAWSEQPTAFLLHDGTRQVILPKNIWSDEELKNLRNLLRAKANPAASISA